MPGFDTEYNSVLIKDVQTIGFSQRIVWDESGTDMLYFSFRIKVAGSVHADQTHFHGVTVGSVGGGGAVAVMQAIHAKLMQPRRNFVYRNAGTPLLIANPNPLGGHLDVNNGPKPQSCDIVHIAGGALFRVEFEIEIAKVLCDARPSSSGSYGAARASSFVLNNRWSVEDTKDSDFYTSRVFEGTLRVSHISAFPHYFRYLCVPPLQHGYQRQSMRFVDSADGLTLKYQISDRQRYAAPPSPATNWDARYTQSTGIGGALGWADFHCSLSGGPDTPKRDLLTAAASVLFERLGNLTKTFTNPGNGDHSAILKSASITEHLADNRVELAARIQHAVTRGYLNASIARMGAPLAIANYDPKVWPSPKLYDGASPAGVFAKYLQNPCSDIHGITRTVNVSTVSQGGDADAYSPGQAEFYTSPGNLTEDDSTGKSSEQTANFPYTYVTLDTTFDVKGMKAALPIARWSASTSSSQPTTVVIPLAQGTARRIVTMHAERAGDWPELPQARKTFTDANGIKNTLIDREITPSTPIPLPDGKSRLYSVQILYIYAMDRAPTPTESLDAGADPRDASQPAGNTLPPSKFTIGTIT